VLSQYAPDFDLGKKPWTCIRHTALRLTLEEVPILGTERYIKQFAENAHTSDTMLRQNYLRFMDRDNLIDIVKDEFMPGAWQLLPRVKD
jgi:hypothetical protein